MNMTQTAVVMKSPIGSNEFCESVVRKRVDQSVSILQQIARLPNSHIALFLLRFQISRMEYVKRTTPLECCRSSLQCFDDGVRLALGNIWGRDLSERECVKCLFLRGMLGWDCGLPLLLQTKPTLHH